MTETTPPELLSIPAAARRMGISRSTLYTLLRAGELDTVPIGRRRLVPVAAIQRFIDGRCPR